MVPLRSVPRGETTENQRGSPHRPQCDTRTAPTAGSLPSSIFPDRHSADGSRHVCPYPCESPESPRRKTDDDHCPQSHWAEMPATAHSHDYAEQERVAIPAQIASQPSQCDRHAGAPACRDSKQNEFDSGESTDGQPSALTRATPLPRHPRRQIRAIERVGFPATQRLQSVPAPPRCRWHYRPLRYESGQSAPDYSKPCHSQHGHSEPPRRSLRVAAPDRNREATTTGSDSRCQIPGLFPAATDRSDGLTSARTANIPLPPYPHVPPLRVLQEHHWPMSSRDAVGPRNQSERSPSPQQPRLPRDDQAPPSTTAERPQSPQSVPNDSSSSYIRIRNFCCRNGPVIGGGIIGEIRFQHNPYFDTFSSSAKRDSSGSIPKYSAGLKFPPTTQHAIETNAWILRNPAS